MKDKLIEYLKRIGELNYLVTVLRWEMDTQAPKKSYDYLINVSTKYEMEAFDLSTSEEYIKLVEDLINSDEFNSLSYEEQVYIKELPENAKHSFLLPFKQGKNLIDVLGGFIGINNDDEKDKK